MLSQQQRVRDSQLLSLSCSECNQAWPRTDNSMGEVVEVSSQYTEPMPGSGAEPGMKDQTPNGVGMRWDRFLQRMMLRVLLVEADDSTRQIITALLRKCGYRVAAVPDGLKAWELLKGRSSSIDLILTEVDLPSICGFSLLTLIREHDICKNIPVIMMSSQDSISTVYKCMMKGAADYLVKPIRRNELRNLWQHVWRRQSSTAGGSRPRESVSQQRVEVTSENEPASNHSNGYVADVHSHKACLEKGSDAQSSCTKPDLESDRQESSRANLGRSFLGPLKLQRDETDINLCQNNEAAGSTFVTTGNALVEMDETRGAEAESHNADADIAYANANNVTLVSSSRNTTDLIGAFADYPESNHRNSSSSNGTSNFDNASGLDLSLRRCHPSDFEDNLMAERHTLRPSNASAFSRYSHRPLQHLQLKFMKENGASQDSHLFSMATGYASHIPDPRLSMQPSSISPNSAHSNHMNILSTPEKTCPPPIQVKGVRYNSPGSGYGSVPSPMFCAQSGLSPIPGPSTAAHPMNSFYQSNLENIDSEKLPEQLHRNSSNAAYQARDFQRLIFEDHGHISPTTDVSASSSFCNAGVTRINGLGYGSPTASNFNVHQVPVVSSIADSKKEEVDLHSMKDLHTTQREAALTKFRLKRKDRCYEKKVRYESRKKLAEQRPRVKGQFVRQLNIDPRPLPQTNEN